MYDPPVPKRSPWYGSLNTSAGTPAAPKRGPGEATPEFSMFTRGASWRDDVKHAAIFEQRKGTGGGRRCAEEETRLMRAESIDLRLELPLHSNADKKKRRCTYATCIGSNHWMKCCMPIRKKRDCTRPHQRRQFHRLQTTRLQTVLLSSNSTTRRR